MKTRFRAVAHIPRGSGDAEYHIVTSEGTVVAIIDPNMAFDDPADLAERIAEAMNVDPEAIC